eukprot:CAMPEP_0177464430 /NCGR_PEP_ID=MMETSP0369-20130122/16862_1 /TAXON_ID=447022 ORGANISM="Scrippsiella hangoei-like, Strain SHHI-4" /NCGR_SAMPLE_ID=MMETSP0369 /ASSEMBLY_ACC=CAM_ASM_000364 /LENGTH=57 /DNA_ID=CAMNT_0018938219 /DNA_START=65 /DNA_END=238 /DNA_ORIENTATION=-
MMLKSDKSLAHSMSFKCSCWIAAGGVVEQMYWRMAIALAMCGGPRSCFAPLPLTFSK